ncbi:MAG: glycosyltransferase family 39 protein [Nitrospinota bacterium]|nr:glycosyltransferase family 39 protein [Nitrospinota bacterium]
MKYHSDNQDSYKKAFAALFVLGVILHLAISSLFPLAMDEAYYWTWSRQLRLSYYDHPPMVAYLIRLSTTLFGTNEFSVRLAAVIFGMGVCYISYKLGTTIFKSERCGFFAALITAVIPIYGAGRLIITPDSPQAFFWILSLYLYYRAAEEEERKWWVYGGIATGLGLLSKYTAVLIFPSLAIYLILSPTKRKWFLKPEPYISILIALILFAPVIIWNWQREWVSFAFQFSHGLTENTPPGLTGLTEYMGTQVLLISPFLFLSIIGASIVALYKGLKYKDDRYLFLFSMFIPIFLFFAVASLRSSPEANWPAFSYAGGIVALAGVYDSLKRKKWARWGAWVSLSTAFLLTSLLYLFTISPIIIFPKIEEVHFGWPVIGKEVSIVSKNMTPVGGEPFVFSNHYQLSGELSFYMEGRPTTYLIKGTERYEYANLSDLKGKNAIYVGYDGDSIEKIKGYFNNIEEVKTVAIFKKGKTLKTFKIYTCYHYKGGLID